MASFERHDPRTGDHGPHFKPVVARKQSAAKGEASQAQQRGRPRVLARLPNLDVAELDRVVEGPLPKSRRQILHQRLSAAVLVGGTLLLVVVALLPSRTTRNADGSWPMKSPAPSAPAAPAWDGMAGAPSAPASGTLNAPPAPITIPAVPASIPGGPPASTTNSPNVTLPSNGPPASVVMPAVPGPDAKSAPIPALPSGGAIRPQSSSGPTPSSAAGSLAGVGQDSAGSGWATAYPSTSALGAAVPPPTTANTPPAFGVGPAAPAAVGGAALNGSASATNAATAGAALLADRSSGAGFAIPNSYPATSAYPTPASQPGFAYPNSALAGSPATAAALPTTAYPTSGANYPQSSPAGNDMAGAAYPVTGSYPTTPQTAGYEAVRPHPGYYQSAGGVQAVPNQSMGLNVPAASGPYAPAGNDWPATPNGYPTTAPNSYSIPPAGVAPQPRGPMSPEQSAYRSTNEVPRSSLY